MAPISAPSTTPYDEGITLADIPMILQAEQVREQREQTSSTSSRRPISSLSAEELQVFKYVALLRVQKSSLLEIVDLDDALDLIVRRKNTFCGLFQVKGTRVMRDVR